MGHYYHFDLSYRLSYIGNILFMVDLQEVGTDAKLGNQNKGNKTTAVVGFVLTSGFMFRTLILNRLVMGKLTNSYFIFKGFYESVHSIKL